VQIYGVGSVFAAAGVALAVVGLLVVLTSARVRVSTGAAEAVA